MRPFAAPLLLALVVPSTIPSHRPVLGERPSLKVARVPLDATDPGRRRLGRLTYLGGVRLTSRDPAFGGFSALHVADDRFTLLSDGGNLVRFRMGGDWVPREVRFADLPDGPGIGFRKRDRDSEALAVDPATGTAWVAFEHHNALWRYAPGFARAPGSARPPAMARWPRGGGPEAMVRLADGRFLVIAESATPKGRRDARRVLRFAGDPVATRRPPDELAYVPPPGYDPTEVAELPDGRLLVLNRRFAIPGLFTAKLALLDLRAAKPGAIVHGAELATFAAPVQHDNFEAMAVTRENAETILWIASDDNGEFWEQSLLMKFRLDLPAVPKAP